MDFIELPKIRSYKPGHHIVKYIQEKMNGYFMEVYRIEDGSIYCYFKKRDENIWPKVRHLSFAENILSLPNGTALLGELHCPGVAATSVITLLNDKDKKLQYSPFALPVYNNESYELWTLPEAELQLNEHGFLMPMYETLYPHQELSEYRCKVLKEEATNKGIEGHVLKFSHLSHWYKLKPTKTVDAFVVSHTVSESITFYGKLKAFQVAVVDSNGGHRIIANVSSGLQHDFKLTCNPKDYYGKVMEVSYQDVAAKGKLQFPQFERWRDDKAADKCTEDQFI